MSELWNNIKRELTDWILPFIVFELVSSIVLSLIGAAPMNGCFGMVFAGGHIPMLEQSIHYIHANKWNLKRANEDYPIYAVLSLITIQDILLLVIFDGGLLLFALIAPWVISFLFVLIQGIFE